MSIFLLSADRGDNIGDPKLLSYSGTTKGNKLVLTLKVEVEGWYMGHTLEALESIQAAHKQKPAPAPKPAAPQRQPKAKPLALPTPVLALPKPGDL